MSTYANIKMGEIFVIYGNPFSRKNWKKNLKQVLCVKYYKRVNFTSFLMYNSNNTNLIPLKHFKDSLSLINNNSHQLYLNKIFIENHNKKIFNNSLQDRENTINYFNKFKNQRRFTCSNESNSNKFHFETNKNSINLSKNHFWTKINNYEDKLTFIHDKKYYNIEETNEANSVDKTNDFVFENSGLKINNTNESNNTFNRKKQKIND